MSEKYTRSDVITDVWTQTQGIPKTQVEMVIKTAFLLIADAVKLGNTVEIRDFATFKAVDTPAKAARTGRNPKTGDPIEIPAKAAGKRVAVKAKFPAA